LDALFLDLTPDKEPKIPTQGEKRKRELQQLIRRGRKPVALFVGVSPIRQKLALLNSSKGNFDDLEFTRFQLTIDINWSISSLTAADRGVPSGAVSCRAIRRTGLGSA